MDIVLSDARGEVIVPIWSIKGSVTWCSLKGPSSKIPENIDVYLAEAPLLLTPDASVSLEEELDFTRKAVLYNPQEHYLGWSPTAALKPSPLGGSSEDPIGFLFDREDIALEELSADIYGEDSDDPAAETKVFAGYRLDSEWADLAATWADQLHGICVKLADSSSWYRRSFWTGQRGDLPPKLDDRMINAIHYEEAAAQREAVSAKRSILGTVAFIAWYQSVAEIDGILTPAEATTIRALRLWERPKAGVMYRLSKDYHEANFIHLLHNEVPIHYCWTADEEADGRFRRLSPEYWGEYRSIRDAADGDYDIRAEDLPSYSLWKEDLQRYDWFFQDLRAGKRGRPLSVAFQPTWEYRVVDFRLYGARTIVHWATIRAYSERFKGTVSQTPYGTVCTFFRQNPLAEDEPPMLREWPYPHAFDLSAFANSAIGPEEDEEGAFFESTTRVREMAKNKWAPRAGRTFNSFNGRLQGPEPGGALRRKRGRSLSNEEPSESSSYGEVRSRSSLLERLGPVRAPGLTPPGSPHGEQDSSSPGPAAFAQEYAANAIEEGELPGDGEAGRYSEIPFEAAARTASPWSERSGPREPSNGRSFASREEALAEIKRWAPKVTDDEPTIPAYDGLDWWHPWLSAALLVCEDERSMLRMKTYAACRPEINSIVDIIELALRFGVNFTLYVPVARIREFSYTHIVEPLDKETLDALYAPGYRDTPLSYGTGGAALYEQYRGSLNALLRRPHATAFIFLGGVLRYVAELYNRNLVHRLAQGPSIQVTEYMAGRRILARRSDRDEMEFFVADQVSNSEISLLLGHIPGTKSSNESWLWPPQELMESESLYMRGYLSSGAHQILKNIETDILVKKKYIWRTRADWKEHFRAGQRKTFAPRTIPSPADFAEGAEIFKRSFPVDWSYKDVADIKIPEDFITDDRE
ncbi:hypothetical protein B0H15DRAFT_948487 [Mycena belliarum]|uniref:Uncharacterized protein n=1 Tax=Mycena belliarum TaxID=1033014 RepID=A0AAD6XS89_9AGAR|nr:hypothetical protein B0H15DRAFT_948487 [Mycena belliae]